MPLEDRAGFPTYWERFGAGPRPALAIHCALASADAWAGVASRLGDRITMTAFDLPGHGRSGAWAEDQPEGSDHLMQSVRIAASFLDGQVDLIGHSYGAVVALRLALAVPEAVRSLTLIEPVLFAAAAATPEAAATRDLLAPYSEAYARRDRPAAAAAFVSVWGIGRDWSDLSEASKADLAARIHLINAGDSALNLDSSGILEPDTLEGLALPVLLICGDQSPAIIPRIAENIAARLPDVGVATVPGAGHMAPLTHPEQTAGLIRVNLDRS